MSFEEVREEVPTNEEFEKDFEDFEKYEDDFEDDEFYEDDNYIEEGEDDKMISGQQKLGRMPDQSDDFCVQSPRDREPAFNIKKHRVIVEMDEDLAVVVGNLICDTGSENSAAMAMGFQLRNVRK